MQGNGAESTVATLRVEPAPFPQQITLPCCGNTVRALITERTSSRSCRKCHSKTEFVHGRDHGESEKNTEQTELATDGGRDTVGLYQMKNTADGRREGAFPAPSPEEARESAAEFWEVELSDVERGSHWDHE